MDIRFSVHYSREDTIKCLRIAYRRQVGYRREIFFGLLIVLYALFCTYRGAQYGYHDLPFYAVSVLAIGFFFIGLLYWGYRRWLALSLRNIESVKFNNQPGEVHITDDELEVVRASATGKVRLDSFLEALETDDGVMLFQARLSMTFFRRDEFPSPEAYRQFIDRLKELKVKVTATSR